MTRDSETQKHPVHSYREIILWTREKPHDKAGNRNRKLLISRQWYHHWTKWKYIFIIWTYYFFFRLSILFAILRGERYECLRFFSDWVKWLQALVSGISFLQRLYFLRDKFIVLFPQLLVQIGVSITLWNFIYVFPSDILFNILFIVTHIFLNIWGLLFKSSFKTHNSLKYYINET